MKKILVLFVLLLSGLVLADYSGNISIGSNVATGLTGNTVAYCNVTSQCLYSNLACYPDYDNSTSNNYYGSCNTTGITNCYNNGTVYSSGVSLCTTGYIKASCSSGLWLSTNCEASNQTCDQGNCTTTTSSSSGGGGGSVFTTIKINKVSINKSIDSFTLNLNTSVSKYLIVKNTGNTTLTNLVLNITGYEWYSVTAKIISLNVAQYYEFNITFYSPSNIEIKTYPVLINIKNSLTNASNGFIIVVALSNTTVETVVKPSYEKYSSLFKVIETNISSLINQGYNLTSAENSLVSFKSKLSQLKAALDSNNYAEANDLIKDIESIVQDIKDETNNANKIDQKPIDLVIISVIFVIVAIAAILAYMFWPSKEIISGWRPPKKR